MKKNILVLLALLLLCSCANEQETTTTNSETNQNVTETKEQEAKTNTVDTQKQETTDVENKDSENTLNASETSNNTQTTNTETKKEVESTTPKSAYIDPNGYLGKSEDSFLSDLNSLGFTNVVKIDTVYSNYSQGTICYYLPDGEQTLTTKISYKVSKGPKPVENKPVEQQEQPKQGERIIISDEVWRDYEAGGARRRTVYSYGPESSCFRAADSNIKIDEDGNIISVETTEEQWKSAEQECWNAY